MNINATPGHSSFKNIVPDTTWLKKRSITAGVDIKNYTLQKFQSKMITLDTYCEENKIQGSKNYTNVINNIKYINDTLESIR